MEDTIAKIKELEQRFNEELAALATESPTIHIHIANVNHPNFVGDRTKDFITIWGHTEIGQEVNRSF